MTPCCRGYNLPHERAAAAATPGVRLLTLGQGCELLKWGIIMEVGGPGIFGKSLGALLEPNSWDSGAAWQVDDGCEPTKEEVLASIA